MMAGRGLGRTGGTIDKLESITGFFNDSFVDADVTSTRLCYRELVGNMGSILIMHGCKGRRKKLITLTCYQPGQMIWQTRKFDQENPCVDDLVRDIFAAMVQAQGGDATISVYQTEAYMAAAAEKNAFITTTLKARNDGYIADITALIVGLESVQLGAGRKVAHKPSIRGRVFGSSCK